MSEPEKKHDRNKFDIGYQDYLDGRDNPFGTGSIAAETWDCGAQAAMMDELAEIVRRGRDLEAKGLVTPEMEEGLKKLLTELRRLRSEAKGNVVQLKCVTGGASDAQTS